MTAAQADLLADVDYTGDFFAHLAPAWMRYVAMQNGFRAPSIEHRFAACDLGCGKGVTTLVLAATHPQGEFHGCDLDPSHIAFADRVKSAAGIANARFHARSFADMLDAELPPFDFITLHGVYGWVPPQVRDDVHALIRKRLAPGGLVMVSYNAQPGWAQIEPLRVLLRQSAARETGDTAERVRKAFTYLQAMAREGAGYFAVSPVAVKQLGRMATQDLRYVVHEYLAPDSASFHFHEVAAAMRGIGLAYAGSMTASDNERAMALPPRFAALVAPDASTEAWQAHCDYVRNTTFRRDLYAASSADDARGEASPLDRLSGMRFALTALPSALPPGRNETDAPVDLDVHRDAIGPMEAMLLAHGPATAPALRDAAASASDAEAAAVITRMVAAGRIAPAPPAPLPDGWLRVNTALVDEGLAGQAPTIALACPRTGLATYAETLLCAIIESVARCADADVAAGAVLARVRAHAHPVNHLQNGIAREASDDEIRAYARSAWRGLADRGNPQRRTLELLGVLAHARR